MPRCSFAHLTQINSGAVLYYQFDRYMLSCNAQTFPASESLPLLERDPQLTVISVPEEPSLKSVLLVGTSSSRCGTDCCLAVFLTEPLEAM